MLQIYYRTLYPEKIASMYKIYQSCHVFSSLNFYMMFYVIIVPFLYLFGKNKPFYVILFLSGAN